MSVIPPNTSSPGNQCCSSNCARSPLVQVPPIPTSIQFLYSVGSSVVVAAVDLPSLPSATTAFGSFVVDGVSVPSAFTSARVQEVAQRKAQRKNRNVLILISEVTVHLRAMDGFMAAGRPAGTLRQTSGVIGIADVNPAAGLLFLEVALQAEDCASLR